MKTPQEDSGLPAKEVPITSQEQIQEEMPQIIQTSLHDIANDKFHNLPSSAKGPSMIKFAKGLLATHMAGVYAVLLAHLSAIFISFGHNCNVSELLIRIARLRHATIFIKQMQDSISSAVQMDPNLHVHLKQFVQRLLTQITTNYFKRQNELMEKIEIQDTATVTEKDKQVIYYICGFIVHALRKKYSKLKSNKLKLLKCLESLITQDNDSVPSSWTEKMDRGGLKKTRKEFYTIFVQIERWVRDLVSTNRLSTNSLVNLKAILMDYTLLQNSWKKLFPGASTIEWTVLEHCIDLFLKVRGFAITKLVRRKLLLEQKKSKAKAGSKRKALRKELLAKSKN